MRVLILIAFICGPVIITPSEPPAACLQSVGDGPTQCGPPF